MKKHTIEKIDLWDSKRQGESFDISTPDSFAEKRCSELNLMGEEYKHNYVYIINPENKDGFPFELYETDYSSRAHVTPVVIGIYRKPLKSKKMKTSIKEDEKII